MFLSPIFLVAEATKLNAELKFYVRRKEELEGKGEKVTAANLEKEASASVSEYRQVRNLLEGYLLASEKAIGTIQSILKRQAMERNLPTQEEQS
jgi:hypothetical protein